ncbi:MAG TPA: enoyl-CoA hydratase/isomerase family protein [Bryobacteraceae bacterium]|nr:enoyl-CoA hydratase/isomerase family protein [Bryobacteraceae bacterium]
MATQTQTTFARIALDFAPPVARLTLANPPVNIIDFAMMDELVAALEQIEQRPEISIIVLAGSERAFSVGVDVKAHTPDKVPEMLGKFHSVIRSLLATRKLTIAAVRGNCLGGGAELALVCDLIYTSAAATWGFPEITLACFPPVAAVALSAVVGQKRAADLVLTGRIFKGDEAVAMGLANAAVTDAEVEGEVQKAVARAAKLSPAALAMAKKAFYAWDAIHLDKGLARAEKIYIDELMATDDAREGIRAFIEKRQPAWKGK